MSQLQKKPSTFQSLLQQGEQLEAEAKMQRKEVVNGFDFLPGPVMKKRKSFKDDGQNASNGDKQQSGGANLNLSGADKNALVGRPRGSSFKIGNNNNGETSQPHQQQLYGNHHAIIVENLAGEEGINNHNNNYNYSNSNNEDEKYANSSTKYNTSSNTVAGMSVNTHPSNNNENPANNNNSNHAVIVEDLDSQQQRDHHQPLQRRGSRRKSVSIQQPDNNNNLGLASFGAVAATGSGGAAGYAAYEASCNFVHDGVDGEYDEDYEEDEEEEIQPMPLVQLPHMADLIPELNDDHEDYGDDYGDSPSTNSLTPRKNGTNNSRSSGNGESGSLDFGKRTPAENNGKKRKNSRSAHQDGDFDIEHAVSDEDDNDDDLNDNTDNNNNNTNQQQPSLSGTSNQQKYGSFHFPDKQNSNNNNNNNKKNNNGENNFHIPTGGSDVFENNNNNNSSDNDDSSPATRHQQFSRSNSDSSFQSESSGSVDVQQQENKSDKGGNNDDEENDEGDACCWCIPINRGAKYDTHARIVPVCSSTSVPFIGNQGDNDNTLQNNNRATTLQKTNSLQPVSKTGNKNTPNQKNIDAANQQQQQQQQQENTTQHPSREDGSFDEKGRKFGDNNVFTTKYSLHPWEVTKFFLTKMLWEQFQRKANIYFLVVGGIQLIPGLSPFGQYTTIMTLAVVLTFSMVKLGIEDFMRYKRDKSINTRTAYVLKSFDDKEWRKVTYADICVGDLVRVDNVLDENGHRNNEIPCDLILLSSSELEGVCYVETANLDGETNLKQRRALSSTVQHLDFGFAADAFLQAYRNMYVECEHPNGSLYTFTAKLEAPNAQLNNQSMSTPSASHITLGQQRSSLQLNGTNSFELSNSHLHQQQQNQRVSNSSNQMGVFTITPPVAAIRRESLNNSKNNSANNSKDDQQQQQEQKEKQNQASEVDQEVAEQEAQEKEEEEEKDQQQTWRALGEFKGKTAAAKKENSSIGMNDSINGPPPGFNRSARRGSASVCSTGTAKPGDVVAGSKPDDAKTTTTAPPSGQHQTSHNSLGTDNHIINNTNFSGALKSGNIGNNNNNTNNNNNNSTLNSLLDALQQHQRKRFRPKFDPLPATGNTASVSLTQSLYRGCSLRKALWAVGVCVSTGHETKIMKNARNPPHKHSRVERMVNVLLIAVLGLQLALTIAATVCVSLIPFKGWYFPDDTEGAGIVLEVLKNFATFIILFNNFVPISLYVSIEFIKFGQGRLLEQDLCMYYPPKDMPASAKTTDLNEELGQINFVFCDKTGTLTRNVMALLKFSVNNSVYGEGTTEIGRVAALRKGIEIDDPRPQSVIQSPDPFWDRRLGEKWFMDRNVAKIRELFMALGVCHTVVVDGKKLEAESPDDEALVKAAARFDYELVGRSLEGVTLMAKNAGQTFIRVIETLPFNSVRKRMSVVIRDPTTGKYVLVTKGADTVMLPRMNRKQGNLKHTQGILNKFAEEGLRTLVVCSRELNDDYIEGWLGKIKAAREMIGREKERDQIIDNLAEEIEKDLILIGVTGVEDKLQDRVSQTISALRTAGMNVWMLTGDKRETATNIGFACALLHGDMETVTLHSMKKNDAPVLLTKLQEAVRRKLQCEADWDNEQEEKKKNGDFGILTSAGASRVLGENSAVEMKPIHQRRVHVNKFDDDITAVTTSAAKSVKKKNPNNNSDAKDGNNPRNSKSKDQQQQVSSLTAAAASAAATASENKNKNEQQQEDEEKIYRPINSEIRQKFASGFNRGKEFCCVIDGGTLALALATPQLREAFYELVSRCSSVICCRVSPKQKADVVTMMREYSHDAITTLAIGDGANDVPMIQAAHVGVGISGMEGQQAANSADFAIGQFKHLHRLVLVHGSANYQRISTVIKYSFYKNAILVMTLFFFLIYNAFTGQSLYEEWSFASYNVIFTFFPVLIVGIFDREIFNTDHFHDFPQLYKAGISNLHLNTPIMIWWLLVAILQGLVIFFVIIVSPEDCIGKKGIPLALDGQGIAAYGAVVLVATIQLCFMIQSYGNMQYTAIGGSLLAFFTFLAVYSAFPATVSTTLYGILVNAAFEQIMWLLAVLALVMAILPTLLVRYFQRTLTPVVDLPIAEIVQLADQDDRDAAIIAPLEVFEEDYSADNGDAANRLSEADKFRHSTLTFLLSGTSRNKDELKINDEQDWLLRFVDDEVEEAFHQKYVGDMFRYRVGFGVCSIASIAVAANFLRLSGSVSLVETAGWVIFAFASVFGFFVIQFFPESRSHLNEIMVLLMTIAFSGASIANLIATDSDRQTHPVTLAVILLGLLVLVRPVLLQAIAYMIIVICVYFMWSLIWIQNWSSRDESMRAAELLIVGVTSIIGLAMTEDFHRKMFISRMSIVRALTTAREEQKRSLLLLQNVMPASIVADLRGKTLGQFSLSFERASIVTSDVVKFTNFSAGHESHVVVEMLNIMFVMFDAHASELGIEKIKTIGDAYMCASGIPCVDPDHARKIMIMGLWMLRSVALMCREGTPSIRKLDISVRVGAATGRVQAGVVGRQKLCYDVFGPAVKEATLMESTSRPRRLRVTPALYELTKNIFTYEIVQVDPRERDPESVDAVETVYFAYDDRKDKEWLLASKGNKINITKGGSKKRRRAAYRPNDTREDQYQFLTRGNKSAQTFLQVYRLDEGVMSPYTLNFESGLIENDFRNYLSSLADARTKSERKQAFALFLLCSLLLALYFRTFVHWLVLVLFSLAWVAMFSLLILRTEVNEFEENMEKTGGLDRIIQGTSSDGLSDAAAANKDKKDNDSDNVSQQAFNMSYQHNPAQGAAGAPSAPGSTNDLLKSKKGSRTSSGHGSGNTTRRSSEALDVAAAGTVGGEGGAAVDDRETTGTESAAQFMQAMNFKRTNSGAKSALSAEESPNSSLPARMTSNPASHENLQSLFILQNNNNNNNNTNTNPNQQKKPSNFENHQKYGESAFFKDDDEGNRRGSTNQSSDNHHDGTSLKVENVSQESSSGENTTNNTGNKNDNNRHTKSNDDRATPAGTFAGFSSGKSEINNTNHNNNNHHPQKNGASSPYNYNEDPNIQWVASYFESSPEQANLQHKKISNMAAYKTPGQTNNNNNQPLNFNTATTTSMTTTTTTANTTSTTSQTHLLINPDGTVVSANPSVPFGSFPNNNAQIQQRNNKNQQQPSAVAVAMSTTPSSNTVTTDDQASSPRDHLPPPSSNLAHQQSGLVSIVSPNENPLNNASSNQHGGEVNNDNNRPPSPIGYGSIKKRQSIVQITSPSEQQLPRPNANRTSANRAGPLVVGGGSVGGGGIEKYDASCASVPLGLRTAPPSNQQTPAGSVTAHPMGNNNNNNNNNFNLHNINNNISSGSHVANGGGHINNSTTAHPNSISVAEQQQPQQPQHEPHNHQDHASGGGIGAGVVALGGAASANLFPQSLSNVPSNRQTPSGTPGHEHLSRVHSNQQTSSASSQGDPNLYLPYYAQHRASNQANTALGKNASSNSSEVSPTQSCGNVKRLTAAGTPGDSSAENVHHLAGTPSGKSLEASLNINHHQNLTNTGKNDVSGSPLLSATQGGISNNHNKYSSGKSLNSSHPSPNAPPLLTNQSFGGAPAASFTNGVSLSAHPEERKRQQQSLEERALKLREESERKKGTVCSLHLFLVGISVAIGFVALAMPALFVGVEIGKEQSTIGVFLCLAAIVNVASSTRLRLWHKIVFSVIHSTLFIALYLRNTSTSSANGSILGNSDDAGNLIAVLLCYAIAIYAGYTSEVSIRENFSAGMRVQIENNQVTAAVNLCERLLNNVLPQTIIERMRKNPSKRIVDEVDDASVLFLYVNGLKPDDQPHLELSTHPASINPGVLGTSVNQNNQRGSPESLPLIGIAPDADQLVQQRVSTQQLIHEMNDFVFVVDLLCQYHRVEKIKTVPFLIASGCPTPCGNHSIRLACLARDVIRFAQFHNQRTGRNVVVKAGLHSGKVSAGVLGSIKFIYDVFGDTVNVASRLASVCQAGRVCLSDVSAERIAEYGRAFDAGSHELKGKGLQHLWYLDPFSLHFVPSPPFVEEEMSMLAAQDWVDAHVKDPHESTEEVIERDEIIDSDALSKKDGRASLVSSNTKLGGSSHLGTDHAPGLIFNSTTNNNNAPISPLLPRRTRGGQTVGIYNNPEEEFWNGTDSGGIINNAKNSPEKATSNSPILQLNININNNNTTSTSQSSQQLQNRDSISGGVNELMRNKNNNNSGQPLNVSTSSTSAENRQSQQKSNPSIHTFYQADNGSEINDYPDNAKGQNYLNSNRVIGSKEDDDTSANHNNNINNTNNTEDDDEPQSAYQRLIGGMKTEKNIAKKTSNQGKMKRTATNSNSNPQNMNSQGENEGFVRKVSSGTQGSK